jgi:hypothetical protein
MTRARIANRYGHGTEEYEVVQFLDEEYVLRDDGGDVRLIQTNELEWVEVRCDRCGQWDVGPPHSVVLPSAGDDRWTCFGNDADSACEASAGT